MLGPVPSNPFGHVLGNVPGLRCAVGFSERASPGSWYVTRGWYPAMRNVANSMSRSRRTSRRSWGSLVPYNPM